MSYRAPIKTVESDIGLIDVMSDIETRITLNKRMKCPLCGADEVKVLINQLGKTYCSTCVPENPWSPSNKPTTR